MYTIFLEKATRPKLGSPYIQTFHKNNRSVLYLQIFQHSSVLIRTGNEEREIPAELLLTATGFSGAESALAEAFGLKLDGRGRLGGEDYRTDDPKVFACGDMRRGASLVVWAIAEGRECARVVDEALEGYTNL